MGRARRMAPATWLAAATAIALAGCGSGDRDRSLPTSGTEASAGQVTSQAPVQVSFHAASRFAEQASFGPTPELVAELQAKGFERWLDEQMALPLTPLPQTTAERVYLLGPQEVYPAELSFHTDVEVMNRSLSAPDQLRWRVAWSLSQFIVAAFKTEGELPGWVEWTNLLQRQAFGNYGDTLREVTLNPFMAHFLDNDQNRPKSVECQHCAPNENYARELMQLFSLGVVRLAPDGTPLRDRRGRFIETYTQKDVEELARALTGWQHDPDPPNRPQRNWANWTRPMVPSTWAPERDSGAKQVLGRSLAAGQSAPKDLEDVIATLMAHPNIAPFVALRMIQNLVISDPSPAYVGRVAAVFRNNGRGVAGDMKAVIKAVLLDVEARRGDTPAAADARDGKYREPWLHATGALRGMGCRINPMQYDGKIWLTHGQVFNSPQSVFGYYAPTDRAPGSNLLAPEQRLVGTNELRHRMAHFAGLTWNWPANVYDTTVLKAAGCQPEAFIAAHARSPAAFLDLVSQRYFRGAMSPVLRSMLMEQLRLSKQIDPLAGAMFTLDHALSTAAYGVMR